MEFLAKNFIDSNNTPINNANLLRLYLHILGPGYLKEGVFCFIEVIIEDEVQELVKELEVSNSTTEKKR